MTIQKFHTINVNAAKQLIWSQRVNGMGRIFGVAFRRVRRSKDKTRNPGDLEVLYVRFNVKKHLATGVEEGWVHPDGIVRRHWCEGARPSGAAYDRASKGCFCVFAVGGKNRGNRVPTGYKSIRFDSIRWLKMDGVVYRVGVSPPPQH